MISYIMRMPVIAGADTYEQRHCQLSVVSIHEDVEFVKASQRTCHTFPDGEQQTDRGKGSFPTGESPGVFRVVFVHRCAISIPVDDFLSLNLRCSA